MNDIRNNLIRTRQDMVKAACQLIEPLTKCLTPGKARLMLGHSGASYDEGVAGMEGFSRVLWALVPMLAGKCPEAEPYWQLWKEGIINGTDPIIRSTGATSAHLTSVWWKWRLWAWRCA